MNTTHRHFIAMAYFTTFTHTIYTFAVYVV